MAIFKDLAFPRNCPGADYDTWWAMCFRDRNIFALTAWYESAVLFSAREGWVTADAPVCERPPCVLKKKEMVMRRSYVYKRSDRKGWSWRFPCCKRKSTILFKSMFYNIKMSPGQLLEILWKLACRTPMKLIPVLVFGKVTSEVNARVAFFRDVTGY